MLQRMLSLQKFVDQPGNAYIIEIISLYGGFFPDPTHLDKGTYLTQNLQSFLQLINLSNHIITMHNIVRIRKTLKTFREDVQKMLHSMVGKSRREVYEHMYEIVRQNLQEVGVGVDKSTQHWLDNIKCHILSQDKY